MVRISKQRSDKAIASSTLTRRQMANVRAYLVLALLYHHRISLCSSQLHDTLCSSYVYSPTHFLNNELCMIHGTYKVYCSGLVDSPLNIQRLPGSGGDKEGQSLQPTHQLLHTITLSTDPSCHNENMPTGSDTPSVHLVYDVSFGAVGDTKVPPRMLLFNLDETVIRSCTVQAVKRHKRQSRQGKLGTPASSPTSTPSPSPYPTSDSVTKQISKACQEPTLYTATPSTEPEWIEFHGRIVEHEYQAQKLYTISSSTNPIKKHNLAKEHLKIMSTYKGLQNMSRIWHWPRCSGRETTTNDTQVPNVDKFYEFPNKKTSSPLESIYRSFLWSNNLTADNASLSSDTGEGELAFESSLKKQRLLIFRHLGGTDCGHQPPISTEKSAILEPLCHQSPWEGLFSPGEVAEWGQVVAHYSKNNCTLFEEGNKSPTSSFVAGTRRTGQVRKDKYE